MCIRDSLSKDIDAFITDPQYLPILSPRLGGEDVWACETYDEAANHLKLVFPEGEIDFIVAAPITELASEVMTIPDEQGSLSVQIEVEHPVEIALKKLVYRAGGLKVRDIDVYKRQVRDRPAGSWPMAHAATVFR